MRYAMLVFLILVSSPAAVVAQSLFSQGRLAMVSSDSGLTSRFTTLQVVSASRWKASGFVIVSEPFWVVRVTAGVPVRVSERISGDVGLAAIHHKSGALMVGLNLGLRIDFGRGGMLNIPIAYHLWDIHRDASQWAFIAEYNNGPWRFSAQSIGPAWEALAGYSFFKPVAFYVLRNTKGFGLESRVSIVW